MRTLLNKKRPVSSTYNRLCLTRMQAAHFLRPLLVCLFMVLSPQAHATTKAGSVLATTGGALLGGTLGAPIGMAGFSVIRPPQCAPDDYHGCYYSLQMTIVGGSIGAGVFSALGATGAQSLVRGGRSRHVFLASGSTALAGWTMISVARHLPWDSPVSVPLFMSGIFVSTIGTPVAAGIAAAKGTYPSRQKKRRLRLSAGARPSGAHFELYGRF